MVKIRENLSGRSGAFRRAESKITLIGNQQRSCKFRWTRSLATKAGLCARNEQNCSMNHIAFWGRWQTETHFAKLPDGTLETMYLRSMSTYWIRANLLTLSG